MPYSVSKGIRAVCQLYSPLAGPLGLGICKQSVAF